VRRQLFENQAENPHQTLDLSASFLCVCVVLGFELRTYTLSHSTSPFL
jgi:hypothetical protein